MKKLSLILAASVLFIGASFANPVVKAKQAQDKTATTKTDKKGSKKGTKKGGKKAAKATDDKSAK
ncbi:MAG TPA: hypothetical protein VK806_04355 [Bacteroidia bacterium]|jgi:hypothetical protein|nr:hypothetical protein [Bacteroidia bacterium]